MPLGVLSRVYIWAVSYTLVGRLRHISRQEAFVDVGVVIVIVVDVAVVGVVVVAAVLSALTSPSSSSSLSSLSLLSLSLTSSASSRSASKCEDDGGDERKGGRNQKR